MNEDKIIQPPVQKITSMDFLKQLTKGNPKMIMEMINVYLEETPRLISKLKEAIDHNDWESVGKTAHAVIPSFSTMGMNKEYGVMAKKIQEYAEQKEHPEIIREMFGKIESVCRQARPELEQELIALTKP